MGLDNVGKTSILYALENKFIKILQVKPTKKVEMMDFNILGLPVKIWDMGGQKKYREEYIAKTEYLDGSHILFYVVDIQQPERYSESFEYFEKILGVFEVLGIDPRILILLHKNDPEIKDDPKVLKNKRDLKSRFLKIPHALNIEILETSIYESDQLNNILIQEILKVLPKGKDLSEILTNFMKELESRGIILIDQNLLTIAEAAVDHKSKDIIHICGPHFATMAEKLRQENFILPEKIEGKMGKGLYFKYITQSNTGFYLIFYTESSNTFDKINKLLPTFTKNLFEIMDYLM